MKKYQIIILLSIFALINATYLSVKAYDLLWGASSMMPPSSFCDINTTFSCTNAIVHGKTQIFGIPFPMIALGVYPIILILAILGNIRKRVLEAKILAVLSFFGVCFNAYIITQEVLYVHSYCILCLLCTAIIISIFLLSLCIIKNQKK